jgi:hypothetical protein
MMRRVGLVLVVVVLGLGSVPVGAAEGPGGDGSFGYNDRHVWAGYEERPAEVASAVVGLPRRPTRFCVRLPLPNQEAPPDGHGPYTPAEMRALARATSLDLTPGAWHSLICYRIDEDLPYFVTFAEWDPADPTSGQTTTVENVAAYARELIDTPAPTVHASPPPERQITGLETWFAATTTNPAVRTAQAGPLWATAEAVVQGIVVDPGDGAPAITCVLTASVGGAETPTARPDCLRHVYVDADARTGVRALTVRAHVVYDVYLTTSDDPVRRLVDTLDGDETTLAVTVREIQTVLR